ncbi:iclR helix-turn-helix domain protein [Mycobacterium kansasii]|uniref:IclR helix-turn-helix domain protein n=1 Tax=Mycobacterium kansasii TaxID=1768 RepID=A0A1V3XSV5_MYCKA|nr:iclR helix-turn-helix domain protein [Mycobacterium kansasii]
MGLLHAIAESPCGLAELCDRTGLPRATAYRLAAALEVHRLLGRDEEGRWRLGPAVSELAAHVNDSLLAASNAVLPKLRETTGESVQLYRREGTTRVCVAALEPAAGLRDTVPVGARLPMTAGSGPRYCWPTVTRRSNRRCCRMRNLANGCWPKCAGGVGRKAWPNGNLGWQAFRRRCAIAAALWSLRSRFPAPSTGWAAPGARWAADLVAAAEEITGRL